MIILTTSTAAQKLSIIPRIYADGGLYNLSITDDSTNITKKYDGLIGSVEGNLVTFDVTFAPVLVEGHFYDISVNVSDDFWQYNFELWQLDNVLWNEDKGLNADVYNGKFFCTDQDIIQLENKHYNLNKDEYVHYNGFDNTYQVP
jgi:hypothetical protein|tara:strand:- start:296 stop:730 length:435 start_codon:yes stop_codon:yes gene_type:complete